MIRQCRYKCANHHLNVVPTVYNNMQSSFLSLAWPWSGRSFPKKNQWECWEPWTGGPMWSASQSTCHPNGPWHPPTHPYLPPMPHDTPTGPNAPTPHTLAGPSTPPAGPLTSLPPEQKSNCQEWYYCQWAWHVITLWVRLLLCQMYPTLPHAPSMAPGKGIWWPRVLLP